MSVIAKLNKPNNPGENVNTFNTFVREMRSEFTIVT
jgi:hypothetical protein